MSAEISDIRALLDLGSPDTWPQGIIAAADLREQRAQAAAPGPYVVHNVPQLGEPGYQIHAGPDGAVWLYIGELDQDRDDAEHIAAEANPAHALAAVRRWRETVKRHHRAHVRPMFPQDEYSPLCVIDHDDFPCEDLRLTADEARAYLGGAS